MPGSCLPTVVSWVDNQSIQDQRLRHLVVQQSFLSHPLRRHQASVGLNVPPSHRRGGASYGHLYTDIGKYMRLRLWAPKDCGTSACIRSIVNMVLLKLMMFVRRADSYGMIQAGSKVMTTESSDSMSSPAHARTYSWRGWLGFYITCRPVRRWIFDLGCCVKATVRTRKTWFSMSYAKVHRFATELLTDM